MANPFSNFTPSLAKDFVKAQYLEEFGREADPAGLNYWKDRILSGGLASQGGSDLDAIFDRYFIPAAAESDVQRRADLLQGGGGGTGGGGTGGTGGGGGGFNIPTDVFPQSMRFSGVNWQGPIAGPLADQIVSQAQNLPGLAEQLPGLLQNYFGNLMRTGLNDAFQGEINSLASRGMLDSSVAADTLAGAGTNIMEQIGNKGYESMLQGLRSQMEVPGQMAQIAGLDQVSFAQDQNPLAPYALMADVLALM